MGLLDVFNSDEGRMGLGLLAAGSARSDGAGFGQRLQEAVGGVDAWKQSQQRQKMLDMQAKQAQFEMDKAQRAQADDEAMRSAATSSYRSPGMANAMSQGPAMGGGAVPRIQSGLDMPSFIEKMYAINPLKAQEMEQSMQPKYETLAAGSSMVKMTPNGPQVVLSTPKEKAAPAAVQEYEYAKAQGYSGSFEQWNTSQKKAGATNVSNTVSVAGPENAYNQKIGNTLADESTSLVAAAKLAPMVIDNARMIKASLDNGAITGTGAESRLAIQKAAETLGIAEPGKAATTQQLMSGLGKLTLSGIKTSGLGGGNGFTDKDREFLNAAMSGNITDSPQNLRRVADLSERVARATHAKGQQVLDRWKKNPSLAAVAQDSQLDPIQNQFNPTPSPTLDKLPTANLSNKGRMIRDTQTGKTLRSNGMSWVEAN